MRADPSRRFDPLTSDVLDRLSAIAREDLKARLGRKPRWQPYADRVVCTVLCQGAAMHYVDGSTGVKDLDVWTFFSQIEGEPFPHRWATHRRFDRPPFVGHYVDLMTRSLNVPLEADPLDVIRDYLRAGRTNSARYLARKAAVLLDPPLPRGHVAWP